jgi:tetratricopeptide (TPR) repeat protein
LRAKNQNAVRPDEGIQTHQTVLRLISRNIRSFLILLFFSLPLWLAPSASGANVRVWEDKIVLPTYDEGAPDINPPFDFFRLRGFSTYPYPTRENLLNQKSEKTWRTLALENEFLKVVVLPDLGGRLYSCVDKSNGREMFYANSSIKYAQVAYRGAWVALGIEYNFPVSHNWMTVSPVDYGIVESPDGSAAIWVGNVDRPYGMVWRVSMTLHPGNSLLEQTITLYNPGDLRHRFYWWNTASVQVWDGSRILYPMQFTASHGFKDVDRWPVDSSGKDLSLPANHTAGFVSRFAHATREGFMGVYHPQTRSGMAHFAEIDQVPAKKIWSWGADAEGMDWRHALSDDESAYVEVQAGLFRNQETYAFLNPQQLLQFHEYWLPIREIGGFSRVNQHGAIQMERHPDGDGKISLSVGINVTREIKDGQLRLKDGERVVQSELFSLLPSGAYLKTFRGLENLPAYGVEVITKEEAVLLAHTENQYDWTPAAKVVTGPMTPYRIPPQGSRSEGDYVELGKGLELKGNLLDAYAAYLDGLSHFPESFELNRAAGRLGVQLKRFTEARAALSKAVGRISNDAESLYYLGNSLLALGETTLARQALETAELLPEFRVPSLLLLARISAQGGQPEKALSLVRRALAEAPNTIKAGMMEVALLRHTRKLAQAREALKHWQALDPPNSFLRHESVLLGAEDASLWIHLASDPERILEVALPYIHLGLFADAADLLGRHFPTAGIHSEPGMPSAAEYPLIAYYRGYCREKSGSSAHADFELARRLPTRYVFPNRPESMLVLRRALEANPADGTAHFLLGNLYMSGGMVDLALQEWEAARLRNPRIPTLQRNLGYGWLHGKQDPSHALSFFEEGIKVDPANLDNYLGLDQSMSLLKRPAAERVAGLMSFPKSEPMPPVLVMKLALALVEAGQMAAAEALWPGRYFPREEFGTNVRQVYLEGRVQMALALARKGDERGARTLLDSLGKQVPGLAFTDSGLDAFIRPARIQYLLGEICAQMGDQKTARTYWQKAAESQEARQIPFAYEAARRLGNVNPEEWKSRLNKALAELEDYLAGSGNFPGAASCSRGMVLMCLGRQEEAQEQLRRVFYLPDKGLSHYLARKALAQSIE